MLHFPIRLHLKYTLQAHTARDFQRRGPARAQADVWTGHTPRMQPCHSGRCVDNRLEGQGRREAQLPGRAPTPGLGNRRAPCGTQGEGGSGRGEHPAESLCPEEGLACSWAPRRTAVQETGCGGQAGMAHCVLWSTGL